MYKLMVLCARELALSRSVGTMPRRHAMVRGGWLGRAARRAQGGEGLGVGLKESLILLSRESLILLSRESLSLVSRDILTFLRDM